MFNPTPITDEERQVMDAGSAAGREELLSRIAALEAQNKLWQQNMREAYEAFTAMRNDLNELFPMQSAEADLLDGPEWSVTCAAIVDAARDRFTALEAQLAERVKVKSQHVAYYDDGQFHWMSGIAPRNCELFALEATPPSPQHRRQGSHDRRA